MITDYSKPYYKNLLYMTEKFWEELYATLQYFQDCRTVLDMGAGTGRTIQAFEPQIQWFGIDNSPGACEIAAALDRPVEDRDATATRMPSDAFDGVMSHHLLEHLKEPQKAIEESVRLSRKVAVHMFPLGRRDDPTHEHEFASATELLTQSFGRQVDWFESTRLDRKRYGVIALRV